MSALRRLHRRLDALPQWLQIVAAVGALALALGLGALVLNATDGQSAADEAAYDNGLRLARSMTDGVSSRDEIASACFAALSAAQASNQGIEATYTSGEADAFTRGCKDGAPEAGAQLDATSETATSSAPPAASPTPRQSDGAAGEIVLPDNWAGDTTSFVARPERISSGNRRGFGDLRWSGWGSKRAIGKGLEYTSDCVGCPENPPTAVTLIVSEPTKCKGRTFYLAARIERPNAEPESRRLIAEPCETSEDPFYDATVRESGMTEAELESFFQRAVENGQAFARDYGDYAGGLAACNRLVGGLLSGEVVPPQVADLATVEQQVVALAALGRVAAQGCSRGVGLELAGG